MAPLPGMTSHLPSLRQKSAWISQMLWHGRPSTLRYPGSQTHSASPDQRFTIHLENSLHAWNLQGSARSPVQKTRRDLVNQILLCHVTWCGFRGPVSEIPSSWLHYKQLCNLSLLDILCDLPATDINTTSDGIFLQMMFRKQVSMLDICVRNYVFHLVVSARSCPLSYTYFNMLIIRGLIPSPLI